MSVNLNPEKALIFRIVHLANVPWILEHGGLYCRSALEKDPNYVDIGNTELIDKRAHRHVPLAALSGIGCHNAAVQQHVESLLAARGQEIAVKTTPTWYF